MLKVCFYGTELYFHLHQMSMLSIYLYVLPNQLSVSEKQDLTQVLELTFHLKNILRYLVSWSPFLINLTF